MIQITLNFSATVPRA